MLKIRLVALCALLVPATALAQPSQDTVDPYAPTPTITTTTVTQQPAPPPPAPTPPVVIINPQPEPPRTMVVGPQYETVYDTYNAPVFTTGALVFLASYGTSVIVAAQSDQGDRDRGNDRLYVPVVGPWLALNDRGSCPISQASCDNETTAKVLLIADGIFQAAGMLTMIDGILQPSGHRVVTQTTKLDTKVHVSPTTVGTYGGMGIGAFGRF